MAVDLSIVINTRDNLPGLKRLLESLQQQTLTNKRYEIIIADDSHDRETINYMGTIPRPVIPTYCVSSDSLGYQAGRNRAMRHVESGLILFLDDTCVAPATLLEEHFKAHNSYKHAIVRGPLMPLKGEKIVELGRFTAPQLGFTIINASIPRLGVAQIEHFNDQCDVRFQNTEMYWRLRRSNFSEHFLCSCYCFQDFMHYQEQNLEMLTQQAKRLAACAANYYFIKPSKETLAYLRIDTKMNPLHWPFLNSMGDSFAKSLMGGKLEGKGLLQSVLMDAVFHNIFYTELKEKLKNFS